MFLPLGDTPNPRNFRPYVTWALIGINVLVYLLVTLPLSGQGVDPRDPALQEYLRAIAPSLPPGTSLRALLAQTSAYDLVVFAHGYKPGAPELGDLVSSMFLHAGFLHLAGNMLFLWIFGDNIEHRLGRLGYLAAYLATGAAATLGFSLLEGRSLVPLVGASGAISGVLGAYFLLFPRNRVKLFVALFPFFFDVVLLPVRWVLAFYVLVDNLLPLLLSADSGVAYGAHLGGFVAGLLIAWGGEAFGWQWPWRASWRPDRTRDGPTVVEWTDPLAALRAAVADGDRRRALEAIGHVRRGDLDALGPSECVILAAWLDEAGHAQAATSMLRRCLAGHPRAVDVAKVYLALGLMRLQDGQPTAAYQHLLSALDSDPDPDTEARARAALARIDVYRRMRRG